tara:strand:+ start:304 stop:507 length:204 start_codon:yes stop_codon:yes gene_type:complete
MNKFIEICNKIQCCVLGNIENKVLPCNLTNRDIVQKLFFKRTGIPYQNWLQAMAITLTKKNKSLTKK